MKKTIYLAATAMTLSCLTITAPSHAGETLNNAITTSGLPVYDREAVKNLNHCFQADMELASSKAIRACSKAYRNSVPRHDIRSDILTQRGLLQLSAGRFSKASRDFEKSAKLNNVNEFAYLGQGYSAIMEKDYTKAETLFKDCMSHGKAAPLAAYGMGIAQALSGDKDGAIAAFQKAAQLRPDWNAPKLELSKLELSRLNKH